MSEENAAEQPAKTEEKSPKTRKKVQRRPIFVMIPQNIDDLTVEDQEIPGPPEEDEEGRRPTVEFVELQGLYHIYAVPPGPGQKKQVLAVLAKHNIDLQNINRVKLFSGEKPFKVERTQLNIRF